MTLVAIVVVSVLLALVWVFRDPFFQQPDENAHADYAFAISTTGHLIRARDGPLQTDVHPYTRRLESVSNFRGIRMNPDGRVPRHYGESAFYREVDAHKPVVDPKLFEQKNHPVPYVAGIYSFVFYGAEAIVARTAAALTGGSITSMLFAMRLFCVALMAAMLLFSFAIMRELHIAPRRALLIVAAVGFFPLVSWHSAYVQQDNFACAISAAVVYAALRVRRLGISLSRLIPLGLILGLAAATKLPYFAATAFSVTSLVAAFFPRRTSPARWAAGFGILLAPSIALIAVSQYFSHTDEFAHRLKLAQSNRIVSAFHSDFWRGLAETGREIARATWSTFGFGDTSAGFWHGFSWYAGTVLIGTFEITFVIHAIIVTGTLATTVLMIYRQWTTYRRLITIWRNGSPRRAFRVWASDPVLNSYFAFVVLLLLSDALSNGALSSNRYWVVFIAPAFLCGTWYAPRVLQIRYRQTMGNSVLVSILAFCIISVPYSWRALEQRYYIPLPPGHQHYDAAGIFEPEHQPVVVRRGETLRLHGWALDSKTGLPAHGVMIAIDGRRRFAARYGLEENNFALLLHDDATEHCGFAAAIDTRPLSLGSHTATVFVVTGAGSDINPTRKEVVFVVNP